MLEVAHIPSHGAGFPPASAALAPSSGAAALGVRGLKARATDSEMADE